MWQAMTALADFPDAARQDELVAFAAALVRAPSVLGNEGAMAERVAAEMRALHYDTVEIDPVGNVVGVVEGPRRGPTLLLDAHLDTIDVDPREAWTRDPFGGQVMDGRIHGRGASDMKGALAAMVHAAVAAERAGISGRIVVSGSVGEELVEGAALRAVMERYPPDLVIIGEASGLDLVRAGRGRAELVLETVGRPAHASTPEAGVSAIHRMMAVIAELERLPMPRHPVVGAGAQCITDVISRPWPAHSVVPSGCRVTYERRLVPGQTLDELLAELHAACERAGAPDTRIELATTDYTSYTGVRFAEPKWFPPWETREDSAIVVRSLQALRGAGLRPSLSSYRFCTNAAWSAGRAGVPTVGFGPSCEERVHVVDEFLEIAELVAACRGYRALCEGLLA